MQGRTRASKLMLLGVLLLFAASATAQNNCLQDEYNTVTKQTLNCSANDVRVAKVINVRDLSGAALASCDAGSTFNFIADFLVQTTSKSSRSNIGLYFATGDVTTQKTALTGTCSDNIIPPAAHTCSGSTLLCGSTHPDQLDPAPDNCGDSSSTDPTVCLDATNHVTSCPAPAGGQTWTSTQVVTVEINNFHCVAPSGTTQLVLPNCTSWQVPGSTIQCVSPSPNYPYELAAIPGSPSKCNCDTIPLPITVQSASVTVTKNCTTNNGSGAFPNPACSITPEGGSVTYTVTVTNSSNFGDVVVDQICDDKYGSIFTANGFTPACSAGSLCASPNNVAGGSCHTGTDCTGATVAKGTPYLCTFTADQPEDSVVTDIVNVKGHGAVSNAGFGPSASNSVTVTSHEAATTASITKSVEGNTHGCATLRYNVDFQNTSGATTDETVRLTDLADDGFASITSLHGSVKGTTCGVTGGAGTLLNATGGGALPVTLNPGQHYTCKFDAEVCDDLVTIILPGGATCKGLSHTNKVTGTETGDESGVTVTESANQLTVYQCFATPIQSSAP